MILRPAFSSATSARPSALTKTTRRNRRRHVNEHDNPRGFLFQCSQLGLCSIDDGSSWRKGVFYLHSLRYLKACHGTPQEELEVFLLARYHSAIYNSLSLQVKNHVPSERELHHVNNFFRTDSWGTNLHSVAEHGISCIIGFRVRSVIAIQAVCQIRADLTSEKLNLEIKVAALIPQGSGSVSDRQTVVESRGPRYEHVHISQSRNQKKTVKIPRRRILISCHVRPPRIFVALALLSRSPQKHALTLTRYPPDSPAPLRSSVAQAGHTKPE